MEIGALLKEAREEKGFTLDYIQEKTKIQKRYLVAIEQNDFNALPGKFYARAFIREYAQAVDLDPEVILANFKESKDLPEEEPIKYTRIDRVDKLNENKTSSFLSFLPTIIVVFLIIAIIGVAIMYYQKSLSDADGDAVQNNETDELVTKEKADNNNNEDAEAEESSEEADDEENSTENGEDVEENGTETKFELIEEGIGSSPESTLQFIDDSEETLVQITTSNETYLEIKDQSDKAYFVGTLTSDSSETEFDLSGQERVYFNIGNASGVSIKINDVELEFPVSPSEYVHQKLWVDLK